MTSMETQLSSIPPGLANMVKTSWMDKPQEGVPTMGEQLLNPNPVVRSRASLTPQAAAAAQAKGASNPIDWGATAGNILPSLIDIGGRGITESPAVQTVQGLKNLAVGINAPPKANLVEGTYSKPGSQVAASLRSNARFDVPAAAADAHPAIAEGLADRGITAADFKGRNGPQALQSGIDNAIDIHEARAKSAIDPIRGDAVDPQVLAQNPELAERLAGKKNITYGDIDAERLKMNKELRRANFYSKDPSAQYAAADPLANTEAAVNQARDLVYGHAQDITGYDLRPLKQTESNLIKLGDLAETTKNTLSAKAAQHEATPLTSKVGTSVKNLVAAKANPISSFFSYEKSGLKSPLSDFNRNMQSAFADVKPGTASRSVTFPRYNLNLTPPAPGSVGPTPMQNILDFSKEAHPEPTPVPRSLGAAAAGAMEEGAQLPEALRSRIPMTSNDIEAALKNRRTGDIRTPFDFTEGARQTIANDPNMPRHPGELQGGHAGGGVASVEELNRPGKNYVVKPSGATTYHGKSFAPESTPKGAAHVTVLPDGSLRVNEGTLTPAMEAGLKKAIK